MTLRRIRELVIPPAWTAVWICASADGHIQATGRDAKGRKQYRYHAEYREAREEAKFEHMLKFRQGAARHSRSGRRAYGAARPPPAKKSWRPSCISSRQR